MKSVMDSIMIDIQEFVLDLLKQVPRGMVTSYGELAKAAGDIRISRVVGQIMKNNHPTMAPFGFQS